MSFQSIGLLIHSLSRQWRSLLDQQLAPLGFTQCSGVALVYIAEHQGLSQTELARLLGIETPSLVPVLDQLEKQALVKRQPSEQDRRQKVLVLLPDALPLVAQINERRLALQQQMLGCLPAEQQQLFPLLIQQLVQQSSLLLEQQKSGVQP
ncbi:MarR family transcriptional regulator [Rheinheimera sp.]|uniref:MarR family winged helix-turn-helix transcriptional regulator n=1 Tax=Rheinheimera sp. TaxID=1869214 RepID=UPI00307DDF61